MTAADHGGSWRARRNIRLAVLTAFFKRRFPPTRAISKAVYSRFGAIAIVCPLRSNPWSIFVRNHFLALKRIEVQ